MTRLSSHSVIGILLFTALLVLTSCSEAGGECPAEGDPPETGWLDEPFGGVMVWKVFFMPDGAIDLDDGDVMYFSFVETGAGFSVRLCGSSLDWNGSDVYYAIDCDVPFDGTAVLAGSELSIEFHGEAEGFTMDVALSSDEQLFSGRAQNGELGYEVQGRRVD
jgi:hypothetical protein